MSVKQFTVLPVPALPQMPLESPAVVTTLDRIRREDKTIVVNGELDWFLMEYPRIFRYHVEHVKYRLQSIHAKYLKHFAGVNANIAEYDLTSFIEAMRSNREVSVLHWDFEAMLNAAGSSLDILARIAGLSSTQHTPPNFTRYVRSTSGPLTDVMGRANKKWVLRLKDYRDCFVHYTPIDRLPQLRATRYGDGIEIRCNLPTNPNMRETFHFRYSRRCELLRYSIQLYRNIKKLDREISEGLSKLYSQGLYPVRTRGLFGIGRRQRG